MSPTKTPVSRGARRTAGGAGFSLVEVMISAAFLLVIALGVLPLFTRSMINNQSGAASTTVSNFARSRVEDFNQRPWDTDDLTVDAGSEKLFNEYYSENDEVWKAGVAPVGDNALWTRVTRVRDYNNSALDDSILDAAEALPAGTATEAIHFKEIVVRVQQGSGNGSLFGPAKTLTLRALKAQ